jgi:hypothetical protein
MGTVPRACIKTWFCAISAVLRKDCTHVSRGDCRDVRPAPRLLNFARQFIAETCANNEIPRAKSLPTGARVISAFGARIISAFGARVESALHRDSGLCRAPDRSATSANRPSTPLACRARNRACSECNPCLIFYLRRPNLPACLRHPRLHTLGNDGPEQYSIMNGELVWTRTPGRWAVRSTS